jgi:hypothetical protein
MRGGTSSTPWRNQLPKLPREVGVEEAVSARVSKFEDEFRLTDNEATHLGLQDALERRRSRPWKAKESVKDKRRKEKKDDAPQHIQQWSSDKSNIQ